VLSVKAAGGTATGKRVGRVGEMRGSLPIVDNEGGNLFCRLEQKLATCASLEKRSRSDFRAKRSASELQVLDVPSIVTNYVGIEKRWK
jgi:hypothetical protein